jgi:broad specificity polyphosphatase/5'/3'-nucleotidase SurE
MKVCHTTEFNYEKSLKNSIDIRKKKYYFLGFDKKSKNGK